MKLYTTVGHRQGTSGHGH